jgi:hypothetical protein
MAYDAFELATGDCLLDVQMLCRHLTREDGSFTASTVPTKALVEKWLTLSHHWICVLLRKAGLSETQTDEKVIGVLQELQSYDVAIKCELAQAASDITGDPSARFQAFVERRAELIELITSGALGAMDANPSEASGNPRMPILTGQFYDRKEVAESDINRTQHRIRRDIFKYPANAEPFAQQDAVPEP